MRFLDELNVSGKRVLMRVDYNVPLKDGVIVDDNRIKQSLPTLKLALEGGACLVICSHLGRPTGAPAPEFSLKPVAARLTELLGLEVRMAPDCVGPEVLAMAEALKPGEVLLLENLRFYAEEEGKPRGLAPEASDDEKKAAKAAVKESQKKFTATLASYAD